MRVLARCEVPDAGGVIGFRLVECGHKAKSILWMISVKKRHEPTRKPKAELIGLWLCDSHNHRGNTHLTTTEKIYDSEEWEFIKAMDRLKRSLGRMPTYSEVLERAKEMGYVLAKTGDGR